MKNIVKALLAAVILPMSAPQAFAKSDHPLIGRYQNAKIVLDEELVFAQFPFVTKVSQEAAPTVELLEGKVSHLTYEVQNDTVLRVARNYIQALGRDGFEVVVSCGKPSCGGNVPKDVLAKDPKLLNKFYAGHVAGSLHGFAYITTQAAWDYHFITAKKTVAEVAYYVTLVIVNNSALDFVSISQDVVEAQSMATGLVAEPVGLEDLQNGIASEGHITLDGVYFDTGTAVLSDASRETLAVIAQFLRENAQRKFYVVGHTDTVGGYALNLKLSQDRAAAVVDFLTTALGVDTKQLAAYGVGEVAPVASNADDAGRAQNRRVELVLSTDH